MSQRGKFSLQHQWAYKNTRRRQTDKLLACEQALGLGVWIFVGGGGGRGGKRTKIQTPSPRACSQARQTCTWFPHLVSVLGSCGREMFRPMAFWSLLFFSVNCPTGQCYRFAASEGEGCRIRRETFPNVIVLFSTPIFTYDSKIWINNLTKYLKIMTKMFAISWKQNESNLSLCYCTIFNAYFHDSKICIDNLTKYSKHLFYSIVLKFWPGGSFNLVHYWSPHARKRNGNRTFVTQLVVSFSPENCSVLRYNVFVADFIRMSLLCR